jgi:RecA/RadA recombinase
VFLSVGYCAFVDAEHALDPSLAEIIGVKTDNLLLAQPDSGEQALSLVDTLIRSGSVDVVVVDSVSHFYIMILFPLCQVQHRYRCTRLLE